MANQSGSAGQRRTKDQAMAARMKAEGVRRTSARCPVCNKVVSISALNDHLTFHK